MQIEPLQQDAEAKLDAVRSLLSACELPTADLASFFGTQFLAVEDEDDLIAVVGLEGYQDVALLRSLAVTSGHRGHGIGRALVKKAEQQAIDAGVRDLYLLTMTAQDFFAELGYTVADRASAPASIKGTTQFSGLCPDAAVLMHKRLA